MGLDFFFNWESYVFWIEMENVVKWDEIFLVIMPARILYNGVFDFYK